MACLYVCVLQLWYWCFASDRVMDCKRVLHLSAHAALEQTSVPGLSSLARQFEPYAKPLLAGKLRRNLGQLSPVLAKDPDRKSAWLLTFPDGKKCVLVDPDSAVSKVRWNHL